MIRTFEQGAEQLQDTSQEMQVIANTIESGALLGRGGQAFTEAIRDKLCPAITRLTEKYQELARDVEEAVKLMRDADDKTQKTFQ